MKNKRIFLVFWIFGLLCCSLIFPGQAKTIWSENFDSGTSEELSLFAWTVINGDFTTNDSAKPTIVNKALEMPNTREWGTWSTAQRNTTVAHGTWSFDYTVKTGADHTACDVIFFIVNGMSWDLDGLPVSGDPYGGYVGYILAIKTSNQSYIWGDDSREIILGQYTPITHNYYQRVKYQFPSDIVGTHHIDITRNEKGEFKVYFDSKQIISYTNLQTSISEICIFGSWTGDSTFDNITVSDSVDVTSSSSPSLEITLVIPSVVLMVTVSRLNKKRKQKL
ncbi:MAG: hypothetical protein ACFFC6_12960 [Promethearchaeota archaeon]